MSRELLVRRCQWCGSTPPRHDRCDAEWWMPAPRTGWALDSVGATIPTYDQPTHGPCECECRYQDSLW